MYEQDQKTVSPGVFATIATGFDLTAKHLWLLVLPILVDTLYWLGPRLRFQLLIEEILAALPDDPMVTELSNQLLEIAPHTNLFTMLSVQIIGVPALMVGLAPENTPITPQTIDLDDWVLWLGLFLVFSIIGLLLTAIYYNLIAYVIRKRYPEGQGPTNSHLLSKIIGSWLRLFALVLFYLILALMIYIPLVVMGSILFLMNSTLGSIVLLIGPFLLIWIIIYLCFAPSGLVLNGRPFFRAIYESLKLVQANLPTTIALLLALIVIGALVDWLLFMADSGTWLTIVNIFAHAFVSTALVTALFVFYRDRYLLKFGLSTNAPHQAPNQNR